MGLTLTAAVALMFVLGSSVAAQPAAPMALSRKMLVTHNQVRSTVGVPPLKWSQDLATVAQEWADHLLASGRFSHRPKSHYGENLSEIRGGRAKPSEVVADWVDEAKDYDVSRNACRAGAMCGHYTQVVWRNTREVGCGVARRRGREVWVCNYDQPGNWVGERPY